MKSHSNEGINWDRINSSPKIKAEFTALLFKSNEMMKSILVTPGGLSNLIACLPDHKETLFTHILETDDVLSSMIKGTPHGHGLDYFIHAYPERREIIFSHLLNKKDILFDVLDKPNGHGLVDLIYTFKDKKQDFAEYLLKNHDVLIYILGQQRDGLSTLIGSYKDNIEFQNNFKNKLVQHALQDIDLWELVKGDKTLIKDEESCHPDFSNHIENKFQRDLDVILKNNTAINLCNPSLTLHAAENKCVICFNLDDESRRNFSFEKAKRYLYAPLDRLLKNYFPKDVEIEIETKILVMAETTYKIVVTINGDVSGTKQLSENLINDINDWYKLRSAYTQGATAGLFKETLPKDAGRHIGKFLDRNSGGRASQVNREANKQAKEDAAASIKHSKK